MEFNKIIYKNLNAKSKEIYNFQKVSAVLAEYGFCTMWLNNDWESADFIAVHLKNEKYIKVQLKARFSFSEKYKGKNIYICFREDGETYLYPHDDVLNKVIDKISDKTWVTHKRWSTNKLSKSYKKLLEPYKI